VFFDIEGDPYVGSAGLEYLLGAGWRELGGEFAYRAFWAHDERAEMAAFEEFIDFVFERLARNPSMHIYHYAPYEPSALKRLTGRYGTREREVDELLRGGILVDLYRLVRQGVCVGTPSYSLKKLEALYMPARTESITDAGSSIAEYERWLESSDDSILTELEQYNRVDCESTSLLRDWLEARRIEYQRTFDSALSRPLPADRVAPEELEADQSEADELRRQLGGLAERADGGSAEAARLLGDLIEWHRREAKPVWWRFFERVLHDDAEDLQADTEAIADLEYLGEAARLTKSIVHRYRFDPDQPYKLDVGQQVCNPESERLKIESIATISGPGEIVHLDPIQGVLELKRSIRSTAPHPRHLIPAGPIRTSNQREALRRLARSVLLDGIDGNGPYRAVRDLLLRNPPRVAASLSGGDLLKPGEAAAEGAVRLAGQLQLGCLAVQGPPGSGKTRTAAQLAVALVEAGHTVALTANSHAVISNLLQTVMECAVDKCVDVRASQRADVDQVLDHPCVTRRDSADQLSADLENGVQVVAGTAWVFSRPELDQRLDYLIVDEAGQLSLANVCAVGTAAKNLVLVGDPRQLSQPSAGNHPPGAGVSGLQHLIEDSDTISEKLGIFLDHTHRLHPSICAFISEVFYQGRLSSLPDCERQAIRGSGVIGGSGLRWFPVDHTSNRVSSPEEAEVIGELVEELRRRTWIDKTGSERRLQLDDILVVAPYNAQVSLLGRNLPSRSRVGTVDKFQGQQAPVVIISLTTSSAGEIPHGMDFLFSRERLNVAVSRAQALTILVGSPSLLATRCYSVDQLRLANGLCRYVELADPVSSRSGEEPWAT
jgi:AAA domain/RNase_H superfamily